MLVTDVALRRARLLGTGSTAGRRLSRGEQHGRSDAMSSGNNATALTEEEREQFAKQGYFVRAGVLAERSWTR